MCRAAASGLGLAVAAGLLSGCSTMSSINPVNWWHRQEGGKIAQDRPPPPGADDAYPNLATVPAKPSPPDAAAMKQLTDSLVADRTNAQHAAQAAPLADPSSPSASPGLFGVGSAPPPAPATAPDLPKPPTGGPADAAARPVASASMPAVNTPPAPPTPAPRRPVEAAPLEPPPPAVTTSDGTAATAPLSSPASRGASSAAPPRPAVPARPSETTVAAAAPPAFSSGPPARPGAAGAPPAAVTAPVPMPPQTAGTSATLVFLEGSSSLSAPAADEVKAFAGKRTSGVILVTGFGDATSSEPSAQSSALVLGLSRAQAVEAALKQAGIPASAIRVSAEASGRGASLRLIQ